LYVGINGGAIADGNFNSINTGIPTGGDPPINTRLSSFVGGGHSGYNYQFQNLVAGVTQTTDVRF